MTCPHAAQAAVPRASTRVCKDECTQCFEDWNAPGGVCVCLTCFNAGCPGEHAPLHVTKAGHPLAVTLCRVPRRTEGASPPAKVTRLAIAAESESDKYDIVTKVHCAHCGPLDVLPEQIQNAVKGILSSTTSAMQNEIKAWELEIQPCEHTLCLEQADPAKPLDQRVAHCNGAEGAECDLRDNLWLCLTCGNLGCGRQQYGGVSGNGHGLAHATKTSHPVAVKLGTITPEGNADVYCYACNEDRQDPYLAKHLAHFGINVREQEKTEKSLIEMQIEQNLKFEFEMTSADGKLLQPVSGPGLVGIKNLGNSCYLASVMQALAHIPEFPSRFDAAHLAQCTAANHADCWECQWTKLLVGLASGRWPSVSPSQFKHMLCHGHAEFGTMKQQDASEFFMYALKQLERAHQRVATQDPGRVFQFTQAQRIQCSECRGVRYSEQTASTLNLMVPEELLKRALTDPEGSVSVDVLEALRAQCSESVQFNCPRCNKSVTATKTTGFKTFPKYLVLFAQRFTYDNWVPKKSPIHITWSTTDPVNVQFMHLPAPSDSDLILMDAPAAAEPDPPELEQLMSFGFPRGKAKRALSETGNHLEAAMNWLMDHPEDMPEDDAAEQSSSSGAADEGAVAMLVDMGFTRDQARVGLQNTQGNVERAVEWLFSHPEATSATASTDAPATESVVYDSPSNGTYALRAFINHKGPSMHCGHYIAHIRDGDRWIMLNDERVVVQPEIRPLVEEAYVYVLHRKG